MSNDRQVSKKISKSHWFFLRRGLRPVLRRPARRFRPDLILPFLLITIAVAILLDQAGAWSSWANQSAEGINRILNTREVLKF